ncbi:hypothetical protein [Clostridium saccharoperbutylacetonicum]|uniref:hypothetical protein n=1 Tax=Clostridium saccharoperbutylacetonicum TaxID=36745 RepID=UPI0039EA8579
MEVKLHDNCLTVDDFNSLRESVGWNTELKLQIERSLARGIYCIVAKDVNKVVGMGRGVAYCLV